MRAFLGATPRIQSNHLMLTLDARAETPAGAPHTKSMTRYASSVFLMCDHSGSSRALCLLHASGRMPEASVGFSWRLWPTTLFAQPAGSRAYRARGMRSTQRVLWQLTSERSTASGHIRAMGVAPARCAGRAPASGAPHPYARGGQILDTCGQQRSLYSSGGDGLGGQAHAQRGATRARLIQEIPIWVFAHNSLIVGHVASSGPPLETLAAGPPPLRSTGPGPRGRAPASSASIDPPPPPLWEGESVCRDRSLASPASRPSEPRPPAAPPPSTP